MSYDLHFLNPSHACTKLTQQPGPELDSGAIEPSKQLAKDSLAAALCAAFGGLEIAKFEYCNAARSRKIDEPEARRRFRQIELNHRDMGLQIELFDDHAALSLAYWYAGEKVRHVMHEAWEISRFLQSSGKYAIYDPQLEKIISLECDFETVLAAYEYAMSLQKEN